MASSAEKRTASSILDAIATAGGDYKADRPGSREKLLALSQSLTTSLELPSESLQRIGWAEPARFATCKLAVDLNLFGLLAENDGKPSSTNELAERSGADVMLLARLLKHLAAMNIVGETDADQYIATSLTEAFTKPEYRDGLTYLHDVARPSFGSMPAYLRDTDYKCPTKIVDGPFQYAHKTQAPFFQWIAENPPYLECFSNYMAGYRAGKSSWLDPGFYPFNEHIIAGYEASSGPLLVDVGGGLGHDLLAIRAKMGHVPGDLILQDLQHTVEQISPDNKGFEAKAHDFFTPQSVKGARAYYLHSVLHDWDDDSCRKILQNLIPAMRKGYSKLLVNELVVPDKGAAWGVTSMDWLMLALGAVRERTEKDWRELLGSAGFKVVQVVTYEQGTESIIEAEVA